MVIFDSRDVIEFVCAAGFPIKQIISLSLGSEGPELRLNGCVVHTDLFQLNLSPLIYHPGVAVLSRLCGSMIGLFFFRETLINQHDV